jgi:hypothetical protein
MIYYSLTHWVHWKVFKGQGRWHAEGRVDGVLIVSATFDTWDEAHDYVVRYW